MVTCRDCDAIERQFGAKTAASDLRRYRRSGPSATTRMLIELLRSEGVVGGSILDVGAGVGAVYHELLADGARDATHVDVSQDYIDAARSEAERRGQAERVRFVRGDFAQIAPDFVPADVVVLDRVICCYPDAERLISLSADRARRLYGAVHPREAWWMRIALSATNVIHRLSRTTFRVYLHPPATIDATLRRHGLERRGARRTLAWEIVVYARPAVKAT